MTKQSRLQLTRLLIQSCISGNIHEDAKGYNRIKRRPLRINYSCECLCLLQIQPMATTEKLAVPTQPGSAVHHFLSRNGLLHLNWLQSLIARKWDQSFIIGTPAALVPNNGSPTASDISNSCSGAGVVSLPGYRHEDGGTVRVLCSTAQIMVLATDQR